MERTWTEEQVVGLAPDASSAKAGRDLASPRKWVTLGCCKPRTIWGECQGSGKTPYQTEVDLAEPAFKCTCPSRKFPCKHALGLLLLFCSEAAELTEQQPPAWVTEWIAKRDQAAERLRTKESQAGTESPADSPERAAKKAASKRKRSLDRQAKVESGMAELEIWLRDLVRQGLAAAQKFPSRYWEGMAARMIDAQAPGIARMLRDLSGIPASGDGWIDRMLHRLGLLGLLIEGFKRLDALDPETQADIRTVIGWTHKEEELRWMPGVEDTWSVLGQRVTEEDRLRVQRTWLVGETSAIRAMLLEFAFQGQPLQTGAIPGTTIQAEIVFYPGSYPLRAFIKKRSGAPARISRIAGFNGVEELAKEYTLAISRNPWIDRFPCPLDGITPLRKGGMWFLRDGDGRIVPVSAAFEKAWELAAISGGNPVFVFGEWDGQNMLPLSAMCGGRFIRL